MGYAKKIHNQDCYNNVPYVQCIAASLCKGGLLIFLLFCSFGSSALAQNSEIDTSIVEYLTPQEYAFMHHEETKWMLRVLLPNNSLFGFVSNSIEVDDFVSGSILGGLGLEAEVKIRRGVSLVGGIQYGGDNSAFLDLAARVYPKQLNMSHEIPPVNNLSGLYVAAGLSTGFWRDFDISTYVAGRFEVGWQERYLKYGFFNFGLNASLFPLVTDGGLWISTNNRLAFAISKDREQLDRNRLCDVFKCQTTKRQLFKINTHNPLSLFVTRIANRPNHNLSLVFSLGYERKIQESPFSIAIYQRATFKRYWRKPDYNFSINNFASSLGLRYYHNLRKRIATGKAGNGFSANYFSLRGNYNLETKSSTNTNESDIQLGLLYGVQRTVGDRIYYDVSTGIDYRIDSEKLNSSSGSSWSVPIDVSIGFRF